MPQSGRKPRSDALRNRALLLDAAKRVMGEGTQPTSLEAVARAAGVGIGTLYRHFPTRLALYEAVYEREVLEQAALADRLAEAADPVEALRGWLQALVAMVATKRGLIAALALDMAAIQPISARLSGQLDTALAALLARAQGAGTVRADVAPRELLLAVVGIAMVAGSPADLAAPTRMAGILVDGLIVG